MLISTITFKIIAGILGGGFGIGLFWYFSKQELLSRYRIIISLAGIAFITGPLYSLKTDLIIINENVTERKVLLGKSEYKLADGTSVQIGDQEYGECIINNTQDSCVIERQELNYREGTKYWGTLILIKPMSQLLFKGAEIIEINAKRVLKEDRPIGNTGGFWYAVRKLDPKDWDEYGVYDGELNFGLPHGEGVLWYDHTHNYTGRMKRGNRHGKGIIHHVNGDTYEGDFEDNVKQGYGVSYIQEDSTHYEGDWYDNKMYGEGKFTFPNGAVYEGSLVEGLFEGKGKITFPSGNYYVGDFSQGDRHGKGKYIYIETGQEKIGTWNEGVYVEE
jgi:hypothetical protein